MYKKKGLVTYYCDHLQSCLHIITQNHQASEPTGLEPNVSLKTEC